MLNRIDWLAMKVTGWIVDKWCRHVGIPVEEGDDEY